MADAEHDGNLSDAIRTLLAEALAARAGQPQPEPRMVTMVPATAHLHADPTECAAALRRIIAEWDAARAQPDDRAPATRGCDACRVIGPLLTGPGTSGRTWRCECGEAWAPQPASDELDPPAGKDEQ